MRLVVKHQKLPPFFYAIVLILFALMYIKYKGDFAAHGGLLIFICVALLFNGYFLLLALWVESVVIDKLSKMVYVERKIWPYKKSCQFYAHGFKLVSIINYEGVYGDHYEIGLKKDEQSEPVRLISTYFFFEAWNRAVKIANYLTLPIYDTVWSNIVIWEKGKFPETILQRRKILKHGMESPGHFSMVYPNDDTENGKN